MPKPQFTLLEGYGEKTGAFIAVLKGEVTDLETAINQLKKPPVRYAIFDLECKWSHGTRMLATWAECTGDEWEDMIAKAKENDETRWGILFFGLTPIELDQLIELSIA